MKRFNKWWLRGLLLVCVPVMTPVVSWSSCNNPEDIISYGYIGACGHTNRTTFTLSQRTNISNIRVWYDTNIGGNRLEVHLSGPDGYRIAGSLRNSEACQWSWCAAHWALNQTLSPGSYTLTSDSRSICSDPSGKTTLIVSGCPVASPRPEGHSEGIGQRIRHAQERIERGIDSGALTRDEARRLKRELNDLLDDEAQMRADGRLSQRERVRLEMELDRLEKHISRLKQNDNRR
jgi:hypothetical protein